MASWKFSIQCDKQGIYIWLWLVINFALQLKIVWRGTEQVLEIEQITSLTEGKTYSCFIADAV